MDNQNNYPFHFDSNACKTCGGQCCRGDEGYIWISIEELEKIATIRKIKVSLFYRKYIRQVNGSLSLQESVINGEHLCCFFDLVDCQCTIYQSRPRQCRTFPFWNKFRKKPQELLDECPGVTLK